VSLGASFYLQYTIPQYRATTTILVKDEQKEGGLLWAGFSEMGIGKGLKSNLENEIVKSRSLAETTVKKLNLNVSLISRDKL
jgi:uncharacterized protein involved in exopolysaccharide biosynthesis